MPRPGTVCRRDRGVASWGLAALMAGLAFTSTGQYELALAATEKALALFFKPIWRRRITAKHSISSS